MIIRSILTSKKCLKRPKIGLKRKKRISFEILVSIDGADEGYLLHISFKTAVRTRLITGVYSNAQCKKIVDTYMSNKKDLRRADISLKDICSYEYCKNKQIQYLPV